MSEMYEGLVFRSDESSARSAFAEVVSPLRLRLVRLADGVFGVYRFAGRADPFDPPAVEQIALQLSRRVGQAAALFYDNRCDVEAGILYEDGHQSREFGEGDGWWVPYLDSGELALDGPRYRLDELQPDVEYDCIVSAIDAALETVPAGPQVNASIVKQAFCYDEPRWLADAGGRSDDATGGGFPD